MSRSTRLRYVYALSEDLGLQCRMLVSQFPKSPKRPSQRKSLHRSKCQAYHCHLQPPMKSNCQLVAGEEGNIGCTYRVPIFLGINVARTLSFSFLDDCCKAACDHDSLNCRAMFLDRLQDASSTSNGRIQEFGRLIALALVSQNPSKISGCTYKL